MTVLAGYFNTVKNVMTVLAGCFNTAKKVMTVLDVCFGTSDLGAEWYKRAWAITIWHFTVYEK